MQCFLKLTLKSDPIDSEDIDGLIFVGIAQIESISRNFSGETRVAMNSGDQFFVSESVPEVMEQIALAEKR